MEVFAAIAGRFLGLVLAQLAPVIVEIIREAAKDTVVEGVRRDDLRNRLLERVRNANDLRSPGGAGPVAGDNQESKGVGGGEGRR